MFSMNNKMDVIGHNFKRVNLQTINHFLDFVTDLYNHFSGSVYFHFIICHRPKQASPVAG